MPSTCHDEQHDGLYVVRNDGRDGNRLGSSPCFSGARDRCPDQVSSHLTGRPFGMGQSRRFDRVPFSSGLSRCADIVRSPWHVSHGQDTDSRRLQCIFFRIFRMNSRCSSMSSRTISRRSFSPLVLLLGRRLLGWFLFLSCLTPLEHLLNLMRWCSHAGQKGSRRYLLAQQESRQEMITC